MNKIMKSIFSVFGIILCMFVSFLFGFILCALLFVGAGEGNSDWGDCATWVGSGVAFLALIAAVVAAYLSLDASNKQNENSTTISLFSISESRSTEIEKYFHQIEKSISAFFQEDLDNHKNIDYIPIDNYQSYVVIVAEFMEKIKILISRTVSSFESAHISTSSKQELVENFFSFLPYFFVRECLIRSGTELFFNYSCDEKYPEIIENIKSWRQSYESDISYIRSIILKYDLFPDLTEHARKHNLL